MILNLNLTDYFLTLLSVCRKITQYSPSESSKMYDKNLSRKSNTKFNPKATIQKLKYGLEINTDDLQKAKQELIAYYLEVCQNNINQSINKLLYNLFLFFQLKHLIINLDPDDEGNEDVVTPKTPKTVPSTPSNHITNTPTTPNHIDSSNTATYDSPEYQKQVS